MEFELGGRRPKVHPDAYIAPTAVLIGDVEIARNLTQSGLQPTSVAYRMARHYALVLQVKARQIGRASCRERV